MSGPRRAQAPSIAVRDNGTDPIAYTGHGYGVEPCPGCGKPLLPGQPRMVQPGVWRPHHEACMGQPGPCSYCDEEHPMPHDGSCLL